MTATTRTASTATERKRRRRTAVRISFAAVALLGIGAAATSAAWTDDAWFSATASGASIELQGSLDGTTWTDADTSATAVTIPAATFANLGQGASKTVTIQIKNSSTVPVTVAQTVTPSGNVFVSGTGYTTPATITTDFSAGTLAAGATKSIVVTVTTPPTWPSSYQGQTGSVTLTYTGTQA